MSQRSPPHHRAGQEVFVAALGQGLHEVGAEVAVVTTTFARGQPRTERLGDVAVARVPSRPGVLLKPTQALFVAGAVLARARALDVVHAHCVSAASLGAVVAAAAARVPVVVTPSIGGAQGELAALSGRARPLAAALRFVDAFLAYDDTLADELAELGVPRERVHPIGNGVDTRRFRPATHDERHAARNSLSLRSDGHVVVFVGELSARKNVSLLLDAWREIARVHPSAQLVVVGDGPQRDVVEAASAARASSAGSAPSVIWTGAVEDVRPALAAADVFVLPSQREAWSMALLEALACGVPVIASRAAVPMLLPVQDRAGVIVDIGSATMSGSATSATTTLARAVAGLLSDEAERARLAQGARALALEHDLSRVVQRHLEIYAHVVERAARARVARA